jgi:hypothetical protein
LLFLARVGARGALCDYALEGTVSFAGSVLSEIRFISTLAYLMYLRNMCLQAAPVKKT